MAFGKRDAKEQREASIESGGMGRIALRPYMFCGGGGFSSRFLAGKIPARVPVGCS